MIGKYLFLAAAMVETSRAASDDVHSIANIFKPVTTSGKQEYDAAMLSIWVCAAIFVIVVSLLTYTLIRFRRRSDERKGCDWNTSSRGHCIRKDAVQTRDRGQDESLPQDGPGSAMHRWRAASRPG